MEILETYAINHPTEPGRDIGLLKVTHRADGAPHLATSFEITTMDGAGLKDGAFRLSFLKTELCDPTQPRRFRHLRLVNDNGGHA